MSGSLIKKEDSSSEKDKIEISSIKSINLINFINTQVNKAIADSDLKQKTLSALLDRLETESEEDRLSNVELLKLFEIISKSENEFSLGVLNSAKDLAELQIKKERSEEDNDEENITSKDIQKAKKIHELLTKIGKSEF